MVYPDDFNTPTFPAGKSIAVSRAMGIGIMSAFLIIVFLCGILIWTIRSMRSEPYILATDGINDQWRIVMAGDSPPTLNMTDAQLFQQSLVWRFTRNWFSIFRNQDRNAAIWEKECRREQCTADVGDMRNCALFCAASDDLFYRFSENVLPEYKALESAGVTWFPVAESIRIDPVGHVSNDGGTWRVQATILTDGATNAMDIIAYATVARNTKYYPKTWGYFINNFNAYRVSQ